MLRRDFLSASAIGPGWSASAIGPGGARPLRHSAEHCIFLQLTGGPSQLDTWDPKPDAPREVRGPFRAIRTSAPGILVTELFPRLAQHAHRVAFVRSMYSADPLAHPPEPLNANQRTFAGRCLAARRAVERGARFATVRMFDTVIDAPSWDTHGSAPFTAMNTLRDVVAPMFDEAYTTLLLDLERTGLLERTLVVAAGEFGRTPGTNAAGGRDHWPHCWTALFAGGPVRGGQAIGSSDPMGGEPRERPVSPADFEATMRLAMGLPTESADAKPLYELFR